MREQEKIGPTAQELYELMLAAESTCFILVCEACCYVNLMTLLLMQERVRRAHYMAHPEGLHFYYSGQANAACLLCSKRWMTKEQLADVMRVLPSEINTHGMMLLGHTRRKLPEGVVEIFAQEVH